MINFPNLIYVFTIISSLVISFLILYRKKDFNSRVFTLLVLSICFWVFTNFVVDNSSESSIIFLSLQLAIVGPILIGPLFVLFVKTFPADRISRKEIIVTISPAIFMLMFTFSPINVISIETASSGSIESYVVGDLYSLLGIGILFYMGYAFRYLYKKYTSSVGKTKIQIYFIGLSLLSTFIIAIVASLALPILGIIELSVLGPLSSLFFVSAIAYILLNHRFLDLRILSGRLVYYTFMSFITLIWIYSVFAVESLVLDELISVEGVFLSILATIGFTYTFNNFNNIVKEQVRLKIINPDYDSDKILSEFSNSIASIMDTGKIFSEMTSTINKTLRPSLTLYYLNKEFYMKKIIHENIINYSDRNKINNLRVLYSLLKAMERSTVVYDEYDATNNKSSLIKLMKEQDIRLISTISVNTEIIGFIALGSKNGDIPYNSEEVEFIEKLVNRLSLSVSRSFLFEEVKQFNETLQGKVDEATKELEVRNEQLGEQLRKERDMMDILGHELRTPLGTARNALVMIDTMQKNGKVDNEKFDKYFTIALRNIRREKDLLETILQSARLENSRIQINLEKVAVKEVVEDSLTAFKEQATQKGLDLSADMQVGEEYLHVDRTAIQQIMDNLVSNAVKYTYKGSVKIEVKHEGDEFIRFSVIDTGEGINEEDLKNLGKKFFRANTHLDSEGKIGGRDIVRPGGTGIGLYVIKGLLNEFGSELEITSEFGKGSVFSFKLKKLDMEALENPVESGVGESVKQFKAMKERSSERIDKKVAPEGEEVKTGELKLAEPRLNTSL